MKYEPDKENSNYFMRLGDTASSQYEGRPSGGGEAPRNVFKLKNERDSLKFFHNNTDSGWTLLSNHLTFYIFCIYYQ